MNPLLVVVALVATVVYFPAAFKAFNGNLFDSDAVSFSSVFFATIGYVAVLCVCTASL